MRNNRSEHILIVDDEQDFCWILGKILQEERYKVSSASSGEEAIDKVKKGNVDLIILDVMLPGIDGIETYQRIRKMDPELPVIMITGYESMDITMKAMKLGAVDYITKPFNNQYMINLIKRALSKL